MLRALTVAPVMTACFSSLTSPDMDPEFCAKAGQRHASDTAINISSLVAVCISILRSKTTDGQSLFGCGMMTARRTQMKFCTWIQNFGDKKGRECAEAMSIPRMYGSIKRGGVSKLTLKARPPLVERG